MGTQSVKEDKSIAAPWTLQNVLDDSSYLLGETSTPASENTKRTLFANDAKRSISKMRFWSWEIQDGDALNFTYSATPTGGVYTYSLSPSAGALKDVDAIYQLKFTDQNMNLTWFAPVDEPTMNFNILNGRTDNVFYIKGNPKDGFTLVVNGSAAALPTVNVTGAWTYRYYAAEADFVNTTDTTRIPALKPMATYVAAEVYLGYREQAQYQLMRERYQDEINDLVLKDAKALPFQEQAVYSFRQFRGASNNFKTYY